MDLKTLERSARDLGAPIEDGNTFGVLRGDALALVGADREMHRIDPADYSRGVRVGVGYFDIPRLKPPLKRGIYTLWTRIGAVRPGRIKGAVEARDAQGRRAGLFPADYTIRSLRVPPGARGRVRLLASPGVLLEPEDDDDDLCIGIEWECDNGASFCIGFVIDPTPIDPPE